MINYSQQLQDIKRLGKMVDRVTSEGIISKQIKKDLWLPWKKENEEYLNEVFNYTREEGMPPIYQLFNIFFHPELPLVGLNYSQGAHNLLHKFESGWPKALKLCRGLVFDWDGNLLAKPFDKFFGLNEHPEAMEDNLPNEPMTVFEKYDGHMIVAFKYQDDIVFTTRGSFEHAQPAYDIWQEMLKRDPELENMWKLKLSDRTFIFEAIHPDTKVYVDYDGEKKFVLLGVNNLSNLRGADPSELTWYAKHLGVEAAKTYNNYSLTSLIGEKFRDDYINKEGYVIQFEGGLKVKVKYEKYIGQMVKDKLSYRYLMLRSMNQELTKMLTTLDEECQDDAYQMIQDIKNIVYYQHDGGKFTNDVKNALYELEDEPTQYHKTICRQFLKFIQDKTMEEVFQGYVPSMSALEMEAR